jgi:hypothetical protein
MSQRISQIFFKIVVRTAFLFEPLAPQAISYFLSRRLKELKKTGLISQFKTKIRRLGRFHYKIEVNFDLTRSQAHHALARWLPDKLKGVRR